MYHPQSQYGKIQSLLESNHCRCGIESKQAGRLLGRECYLELKELDSKLAGKLNYQTGEDLYESCLEALEVLDMSL